MSKMPAKKKSCFQITSVIQAQVAGNTIIDDTESNDEPDESRTEDMSSETLEVSRTDLSVCDRSSSDEALDQTGDHHNGPLPVNGLLSVKNTNTGGRNTPLNLGGNVPVPSATQPVVATPTSQPLSSSGAPTSYSSRFRVIKLDHGTGEPFRRGRWACTEFYEKDSESNRTVDSIKATATHDHSIDRDSGLGVVNNSMTASRAFPTLSVENIESGYPKGHPVPLSSEPQQQSYTSAPQIGNVASAFQSTGHVTVKTQQAYDSVQPVISQTFIPNSLNGVHQGAMLQKSPAMPSATQPQQSLVYSNGLSPGQHEYHPLHSGSNIQSFPATSQPMVPPSSQPPVSATAGAGGQDLQAPTSEAALAPGIHAQSISAQAVTPGNPTLGRMGITTSSPVTITSQSGVQSLSANVPSISAAPGHSSAPANQTQDTRPKSDALPLSISSVVPGKAIMKPLITEGLSLPTPTVSLFGISIPVDGDDDSASGASVVAIDNKIEQAMDLVKNHLMYAVREEVEVLKEQIKELYERNSVLERENAVLKSLANSEQLNKLSSQLKQANNVALPQLQQQQSMSTHNSNALSHYEVVKSAPHQPNITTA